MQDLDGIRIWGDPIDDGALSQIKNCAKTATVCALMADHHKGYAVPIGGVVAYEGAVSPSGSVEGFFLTTIWPIGTAEIEIDDSVLLFLVALLDLNSPDFLAVVE